jgi:hypothetical protein
MYTSVGFTGREGELIDPSQHMLYLSWVPYW